MPSLLSFGTLQIGFTLARVLLGVLMATMQNHAQFVRLADRAEMHLIVPRGMPIALTDIFATAYIQGLFGASLDETSQIYMAILTGPFRLTNAEGVGYGFLNAGRSITPSTDPTAVYISYREGGRNAGETTSYSRLDFTGTVSGAQKSIDIYLVSNAYHTPASADADTIDHSYNDIPVDIDAGGGRDIIRASRHDEVIDGGTEEDHIILGAHDNDSDTIRYAVKQVGEIYMPFDGGDTIDGLRPGQDSIAFDEIIVGQDGDETQAFSGDFLDRLGQDFKVALALEYLGGGSPQALVNYQATGIVLHFKTAAMTASGRLTGSTLKINFDSDLALRADIFIELLGDGFDNGLFQITDAEALKNLLAGTIHQQAVDISEHYPINKAVYQFDAPDGVMGQWALTPSTVTAQNDNALFRLDATGKLWWQASPDFETPRDFNGDNSYRIEAVFTAENGVRTTHTLAVQIGDIMREWAAFYTDFMPLFPKSTRAIQHDQFAPEDLPSEFIQHLVLGNIWTMPAQGPLVLKWAFFMLPPMGTSLTTWQADGYHASFYPYDGNSILTNQARIDAARQKLAQAMAEFEAAANIRFVEVDSADVAFADIAISFVDPATDPSAAGQSQGPTPQSLTYFFNTPEQVAYRTIVHELHHALGMAHPFEINNGWPGTPGYRQSPDSIGSYNANVTHLKPADITLLQWLYGPPKSDGAGSEYRGVESLLPPTTELVSGDTLSLYENHPLNKGVLFGQDESDGGWTLTGNWTLPGSTATNPNDNAFFRIDAADNILWRAPPDFENPADSDGDNIYHLALQFEFRANLRVAQINRDSHKVELLVKVNDLAVEPAANPTAMLRQNLNEAAIVSFTPMRFYASDLPDAPTQALLSGKAWKVSDDGVAVITWSLAGVSGQAFIDSVRENLTEVFAQFEAAANIRFVEVAHNANGRGSIAITVDSMAAVYSSSRSPDAFALLTLPFVAMVQFNAGSVLRELGYVLGLSNPAQSSNGWQAATTPIDSIISTNGASALTAHDIAALQFLYGSTGGGGIESLAIAPPDATYAALIEVYENTPTAQVLHQFDLPQEYILSLASSHTWGLVASSPTAVNDNALFTIDGLGQIRWRTTPDFETKADSNSDGVYRIHAQIDYTQNGVTQTVQMKLAVQVADLAREIAPDLTAEQYQSLNDAAIRTLTPYQFSRSDLPSGAVQSLISGTAWAVADDAPLTLTWSVKIEDPARVVLDQFRLQITPLLDQFEAAANIRFIEVAHSASLRGDIVFVHRLAPYASDGPDTGGLTVLHTHSLFRDETDNILRELGKTLGLSDPAETSSGWQASASAVDSIVSTAGADALTTDDIAALQFLYGTPPVDMM